MAKQSSLLKIVTIISGATVFLLVGVGYMSWLLVAKHNEFSQKETSVVNQKENEILIAQYKTLLEKTRKDREALARYVIDGDADTAQLLASIETLAATQSLLVTEGVNLEKVSTSTRALVVTVETEGEFNRVLLFLKSLEGLPHELLFRDVILRRASGDAKNNTTWALNTSFVIKSFQP